MTTFAYPPFPTYSGNIGDFLLNLIFWFLSIPAVALGNFVAGLTGGITSGASSSAASVMGFIGSSFQQSENSFTFAGPFAIIIASAVWGMAILILIFFILKGIQLAMHESEDD